jgi:hypothetical protein
MKKMEKLALLKGTLNESHKLRRSLLIKAMDDLESEEVHCQNCPGTCCTFFGNSMQMTLSETWDLYDYLVDEGQWTQELKAKLEKCVSDFRLLNRPSTGGGQLMRKTYTCPFFTETALGCPLPKTVKPYGCLGFNPKLKNEESGKSCGANQEILEQREESFNQFNQEEQLNLELKEILSIPWDKESIPVALLELDRRLSHITE